MSERIVVGDIPVTVLRRASTRTTIRIIANGEVRVTTPRCVSNAQLRQVLVSRLDWIRERRGRAVPENVVRLLGRDFPRIWVPTAGKPEVTLGETGLLVLASDQPCADKAVAAWLHSRLLETLKPLLQEWQDRLRVSPERVTIRKMSSRWGSCSPKTHRITFNLALVERPVNEIEYVVVHELAHLIEGNHGPRFVAIMDDHLPNWRALRTSLNSS